jgi:hypothetical protein
LERDRRARPLISHAGRRSRSPGRQRKGKLSFARYLAVIALTFVHQLFSSRLHVGVALMWLVPGALSERR